MFRSAQKDFNSFGKNFCRLLIKRSFKILLVFLLSTPFIFGFTVAQVQENQMPERLVLAKKDFQANEEIKVNLENTTGTDIQTVLVDNQGIETLVTAKEEVRGTDTQLIVNPPSSLKPGKYTLKVQTSSGATLTQDFTWGVLAINVNKSIYLPNEQAFLQIAVLNDNGHTLCDANLTLEITSPDSRVFTPTVQKSGRCQGNNVIDIPDYFAYQTVEKVGVYQVRLTNLDNTHEVSDSFEVRESVPFEVERVGPTRIFPPAEYAMTLKIKVNQEYRGEIIERVPGGFEVQSLNSNVSEEFRVRDEDNQQLVIWDVSWRSGESYELNYKFNAPDVSPYLHLVGPLSFQQPNNLVFQEVREWQIASDAAPPSYTSISAMAAATSGDITITLPSNSQNDIMLMMVWIRSVTETITVSGWTAITGTPFDQGTTERYWLFWKRSTGAESNPLVDTDGTTANIYGVVANYSGAVTTGDPWEVVGSNSVGTSDPATCTGITTLSDNSLVIVPLGYGDDNNASITVTSTDPSGYTEHYLERNTGDDGMISFSEADRTNAGLTGDVSVDFNSGVTAGDGWGCKVLALRPPPPTITVGTSGTQTTPMLIPSTDQYVGGALTFVRNEGSANVTSITISETDASLVADTYLANLDLLYETADTCTYDGNETPFGTAAAFSSEKATVAGTMSVGTSQVCVYAVLDVVTGAPNGDYFDIEITDPSTEVTVSSGVVSPATAVAISGSTQINLAPAVKQDHYQWRNDDGPEGDTSQAKYFNPVGNGYGAVEFSIVSGCVSGSEWDCIHDGSGDTQSSAPSSDLETSQLLLAAATDYYLLADDALPTGITVTQLDITVEGADDIGNPNTSITLGYCVVGGANDCGTNDTMGSAQAINGADQTKTEQFTSLSLSNTDLNNMQLVLTGSGAKAEISTLYVLITYLRPEATWAQNEDTPHTSLAKSTNIRLRFQVDNTGGTATNYNYRLEWATRGADNSCDTSYSQETYYAVPDTPTTEHFDMTLSDSSYFIDGDPTTAKLSNGEALSFVAGDQIESTSNQSGNITLAQDEYTEVEYVFQANSNATDGGVYCFRVTNAGTELDSADAVAQVTLTGGGGITISGTVWTNEAKTTNIGLNKTVHLYVNTTDNNTAETNSSGQYSFSSISGVSANDSVIVYLDDETENGSTITLAVDGTTAIDNFDIITDHISLEHRNSGPVANTDLDDIDAVDAENEDGIAISGSDATFSDGFELSIVSGENYTPGGTVTADDFETEGTGTFAPGANAVTVSGDWEFSSFGTFTTSGTVTFDGTLAQTISTGGKTFSGLTINNTGTDGANDDVTISGALDINGTFSLTNGDLRLDTNNPNVNTSGAVTIGSSALITKGSGTWTFDGSSQTLTDSTSSAQDIGAVTIGPSTTTSVSTATAVRLTSLTIGADDTLDISSDTLTITGSGTSLTITGGGTLTTTSSTVVYAGTSATNIATTAYNNLTLTPASGTPTYSLTGHLTSGNALAGDLTISSGATLDTTGSSYNITLGGSWDNNDTFTSNSNTVTFNATSTGKTIEAGSSSFYDIVFSSATGGWTIQTNNLTATHNFTITDTATAGFTVNSVTVEVGGTYSIADAETANTTWTSATLYLNSGTAYTVGSKTQTAETYSTLQVGANTDIRIWNSSASTYTVDSSGSLYSQDHAGTDGDLYVWGDYHVSTNDYWSYATDFDGTALGGSGRQVDVRIDPAAVVTVDSGDTLAAVGTTSPNRTTVSRQGALNGYQIIVSSGGTINFQYTDFDYLDGNKGIDIQAGATVTDLSNTKYDNLIDNAADDAFVTVAASVIGAGTATFSAVQFDNNGSTANFNVNFTGATPSGYWDFDASTGTFDGEAYDGDDGANEADPGALRWDDSTSNQNPNLPSNLGPAGYLDAAGWMNDSTPTFNFDLSDPDAGQQVKFQIQIDDTSNFSSVVVDYTSALGAQGTFNFTVGQAAGSGTYSTGSESQTLSDSAGGGGYYWRVKAIDAASAESSYEEAGTDAAIDFRVDSTAPTGGTVYDDTETGVDKDFNNGSLSQLSANWSGFDSNTSGLLRYDYSIGTTVGGTDIVNWTSNSTDTSVTAGSLTLQTSQVYYFNVRALDNAGNTQSAVSSDGLLVSPTLTFGISPSSISFDNLNAGNSYTSTKAATLTTSTNAYNGYVIRAFATDNLRSIDVSDTIGGFDGGNYASPDGWQGGDRGFGYTSSDTSVQGANKFNSDPCPGGNGSSCYAPFSQTGPGEIVADHTNAVTGSPVSSEEFTITYKTVVNSSQAAGTYTTTIVYTITPQY